MYINMSMLCHLFLTSEAGLMDKKETQRAIMVMMTVRMEAG